MRGGKIALAMLAALLPLLLSAVQQQQNKVFYAIGSAELGSADSHDDVRLYEVNSTDLQILRSVSVKRETPGYGSGSVWMQSGMLTAKHDSIILADSDPGIPIIMRVSTTKLAIANQINLRSLHLRAAECADQIFVHPVTGLVYFSCASGSDGNGFAILNIEKSSIAGDFPDLPPTPSHWPNLDLFKPQFSYDYQSNQLYVFGGDVIALDRQNHPVDYIRARDIASGSGLQTGRFAYTIKSLSVFPNGTLVILVTDAQTPTLAIYDPHQRKVLAHWTETHKYQKLETHTDLRTGKPFEKRVERIAQLRLGPVMSHEGSRLFAMSEGDITLWDSQTLQELARFEAPEPPAETRCFYAAPDGHGMWFVSRTGTVYRLDEQTGKIIEKVRLALRSLSLIRER